MRPVFTAKLNISIEEQYIFDTYREFLTIFLLLKLMYSKTSFTNDTLARFRHNFKYL